MTDGLLGELMTDFVSKLIHRGNVYGIASWGTLSPIELGVLSWHLGNFYCCFCGDDPGELSVP